MASTKLKGRLIPKHDVAANWAKATNFVPYKGELITYDSDENNLYPRQKIGDGVTNVNLLPFVDAELTQKTDLLNNATAEVVLTKTGDIITADNCANRPLAGLTLYGRTVQDGTPTPDSPVELVSVWDDGNIGVKVCGKNMLPRIADSKTANGLTCVTNSDNSVTITGTATSDTYLTKKFLLPVGMYTLSGCPAGGSDLTYCMYAASGGTYYFDSGNGVVFTLDETKEITAAIKICKDTVVEHTFYPQIEKYDTATAYEVYKNGGSVTLNTPNGLPGISVSSGGNYTDSTGQQWICDEIDLAKGVYIQRVNRLSTWETRSIQTHAYTNDTNYVAILSTGRKAAKSAGYCTHMLHYDDGGASLKTKAAIFVGPWYVEPLHISIPKSIATNADELRQWLINNNVVIMYPLETPIENALTAEELAAYHALASQHPYTTIYNDTGANMTVRYVANTKMYIDEVVEEYTSPPIVNTVTGGVVAVTDSTNRPLQNFVLYGKTTQDGTPTSDAPVELVSVGNAGSIGAKACGKNLLKNTAVSQTVNGITYTVNNDGTVICNGTSTVIYTYVVFNKIIPAGKYILSGCPEGGANQGDGSYRLQADIKMPDGTIKYIRDIGNGAEFTLEETPVKVDVFTVITKNTVLTNLTFKPMIRDASITDAAYEPYKDGGSVTALTPNGLPGIPVTSGGNYTDENGQMWICDEVDFGRGVYVKRTHLLSGYTKTGTLTITDRYDCNSGYALIGNSVVAALCTVMAQDKYAFSAEDNAHFYVDARGGSAVFVPTGFDNSNNTIKMLVALATPVETALTEEELAAYAAMTSQYPNTTVINDAGAGMSIGYIADTKNYIDQKLAAIAAATVGA